MSDWLIFLLAYLGYLGIALVVAVSLIAAGEEGDDDDEADFICVAAGLFWPMLPILALGHGACSLVFKIGRGLRR